MKDKKTLVSIPSQDKRKLKLQKTISRLVFPAFYCASWVWIKIMRGYQFNNIKEVRKQFLDIINSTNDPIIICPNHLSFADSLILQWAIASPWTYLKHFKSFAWNLPKKENVNSRLFYRVLCYVGKCVLIAREDNKAEANKSMAKMTYLLQNKESILVFPEGKRSDTGYVDTKDFIYGVGQFLREVESTKVLNIYMRGHKQKNSRILPEKGNCFTINMQLISPQTELKGLRAYRDLSTQIIENLSEMERNYFESIAHSGE